MEKLKLRLAVKEDIDKIFLLSNDEAVRRNSFITGKIAYSDHVQWFDKILKSRDYLLYIVEYQNNFVGQVKFKKVMESQCSVGISLEQQFRGKGEAVRILLAAVEIMKQQWPHTKEVTALVKTVNKPSLKLFSRAGFSFLKNCIIQKSEAAEYMLRIGVIV